VERYVALIERVTERELERWPLHAPFALAPWMQAITLEVIMGGIFGLEGRPPRGTPAARLRALIRRLTSLSASSLGKAGELMNQGRTDAVGLTRAALGILDAQIYRVIAARRAARVYPAAALRYQ
jgi:cytochrome P450